MMSLVAARDLSYSESYGQCLDRGSSTAHIAQCNNEEYRYQDRLLNRYYREAMQRLAPAKQRELRAAQRLWIQYLKANCDFYANLSGGTMDILAEGSCWIDTTARRAQELRIIAEML